ncbi:sigma-70 family RNA polymerase sigma factor [Chitinophagaceae bacterium MMS25-I14]
MELTTSTEEIQKLRTYAYNILGSYEEAKDVVQDVLTKQLLQPQREDIENPAGYLTRSVINHAINVKKRDQRIVSEYKGSWLPEPVAPEKADTGLLRKETLKYSLLVLLEQLSPKERAVFVLKEAFNYAHDEIAQVLDITEDNSRQLLRRAKSKISPADVMAASAEAQEKVQQYFSAIINADTHTLEQLLHKDIVVTSDGGGKATANLRPVSGLSKVIKTLLGYYHKFQKHEEIRPDIINHQPALLYFKNGILTTCQVFEITDGRVTGIFSIRNPDKLKEFQKNF